MTTAFEYHSERHQLTLQTFLHHLNWLRDPWSAFKLSPGAWRVTRLDGKGRWVGIEVAHQDHRISYATGVQSVRSDELRI